MLKFDSGVEGLSGIGGMGDTGFEGMPWLSKSEIFRQQQMMAQITI